MDAVYLDYNASAPMRPQVRDAVIDAMDLPGNPSSVHQAGRAARAVVEVARARVAALVGGDKAGVVFTSGGTEANNLALRAFPGRRVITSLIEHDSVLAARPDALRVGVDSLGRVDPAAIDAMLAELEEAGEAGGGVIVSVMLANNETGVIQPLAEIARVAHARGALVHADAVQAAGRISIDMAALGLDMLSLSAHKLGGPKGVGALVLRPELAPEALVRGGGQELGRRAGTENVAGIAGFGVAAECAREGLVQQAELAVLRDGMEARLRAHAPELVIPGRDAERVANTSTLALPGVAAQTQVMRLDLAGIAVSAGSACSSGKVRRSHVLDAMGFGQDVAGGAIRVSLGWATVANDIERFVAAWCAMRDRLGGARATNADVQMAESG